MIFTKAKKLRSDKADFLLPFLKDIYPDKKAPSGFTKSVMNEISRMNKSKATPVFPLWYGNALRPVAALALTGVLFIGLLTNDRLAHDQQSIPIEENLINEHDVETSEEENIVELDKDQNEQMVQTPPLEITDVINGDFAVQPPSEPIISQENMPAPYIKPVVHEVVAETLPKNDSPVILETVSVPPLSTETSNGDLKAAVETNLTNLSQLNEIPVTVSFDESDIPDVSVFVNRKRIIEVESIRLSVHSMDKVLPQIEDRAWFLGLKPDMIVTDLKEDGTIIVMKSFVATSSLADVFATHLTGLGSVIERKSNRLDVTAEYLQMLNEHNNLMERFLKTGTGVQEIRNLVKDLVLFERRSQDRVKNIIVWIEDGVDF